jgi:septation ring formation regulator EzrA
VRAVPRLCGFYPGICLTTEEKARKNLSQGKKNLSQVKKNLIQSTLYILPKTPTHYKTLTNTHITKLPHTYTHYKTI